MNEAFLNYLWLNQLFTAHQTTEGQSLMVLHPGRANTDSGPDFFNAKIRIGETTWAGNVEIHTLSSDWYRHQHEINPAYDNIILHVVFEEDKVIYRQNKERIPCLALKNTFDNRLYQKYEAFIHSDKWIACEAQIGSINHFDRLSWLDKLMAERLEEKAGFVQNELEHSQNDFHEVFYRKLARNFGFNTNGDAFEALAASLPLRILAKHSNNLLQIEALLFGQAGMLSINFTEQYPAKLYKEYLFLAEKYKLKPIDPKRWKFMRMHPANFPGIRISQFANIIYRSSGLLHKILETERLADIISLFKTQASSYWADHYRFGKPTKPKTKALGMSSIQLLLINTIVPFTFVYGKQTASDTLMEKAVDWLEQLKAENNSIIRHFKERGVKAENAMQSQALLQLKNEYCTNKRCLECRIGYLLLSR